VHALFFYAEREIIRYQTNRRVEAIAGVGKEATDS
jgi:hypothetical protein